MSDAPTVQGQPIPSIEGPCGPARAESESRCSEAERLRATANTHQRELREARLLLLDAMREREDHLQVRDRRAVAEAKESARETYRRAVSAAPDDTALQAAAAQWLRDIHRLNRATLSAERKLASVLLRAGELEAVVARAEAAYDAARVAAEIAAAACLEARQAMASCEEEARRRASKARTMSLGRPGPLRSPTSNTHVLMPASVSPLARLLQGDRAAVLGIALELAADTGVDAGRLQLLLVELRAIAVARAVEEHALSLPEDHPFWGQLGAEGARRVVAALAAMGHRFDGESGWTDGRAPTARDLAVALSHAGYDPRSVRNPPGQEEIVDLWRGTRVLVEQFLLARAPDLELGQIIAALEPRGRRLGELWDLWGRLRPILAPA